jgi:hypothetical protein
MQEGALAASTLTDQGGQYIFANLSPGSYRLEAEPVAGSSQSAPGGGYYLVTLADRPGSGLDFGFIFSSNLTAAAPSLREHPLMRPTPEEAALWSSQYNTSARATLSPENMVRLAAAPPAHSLLDKLNYIASERDQGTCGNCWAWAGTGVMEIDNARQNEIKERFSVQYLDSSYNGGCGSSGACCGGWLDNLASFYRSRKMIVPWSNANAHYQDGAKSCGSCSAVSASKISTSPNYSLKSISTSTVTTHGLSQEQAIASIKGVLLQDKAIWFGFFLPDASSWNNFRDFWGTKPESATWKPDYACGNAYSYQSGGGHAVLCVGYDDTDPSNRYWIMLNSWGTTPSRPAGLFRVSMDMNYDCSYSNLGYAFYWMTLDMIYDDGQNNAPQTPSTPQGPAQGYTSKSLSYTTTSADTDGDPFFFTLDWGDGTTSKTALSTSSKGTANHIWKQKGAYQVKAMATDSNKDSSGWSSPFSINIAGTDNKPPNKPSTPTGVSSGYVGRIYTFTGYASDPNRDPIFYTIDWGDGQITKTDLRTSGLSVRASHAWALAGVHSLRVMATDRNGAESAWSAAKTVTIKNAAIPGASSLHQGTSEEPRKKTKTCPCQDRD